MPQQLFVRRRCIAPVARAAEAVLTSAQTPTPTQAAPATAVSVPSAVSTAPAAAVLAPTTLAPARADTAPALSRLRVVSMAVPEFPSSVMRRVATFNELTVQITASADGTAANACVPAPAL